MKPTADFLLEVGCEEIPAGMIARACGELQVILEKYLSTSGLIGKEKFEVFGAPRRMVAICKALRTRQEDTEKEVTGPPKAVAYDAAGKPTRAAESFAAKQGIALSYVYIVATSRGEYLAAKIVHRGRSAEEILLETIPRALQEIPWPRSMYWTHRAGARFIRPVRWLVALFAGKVLK
ncbi:MAG: glycine--tRNA ligase subunit beta, partial [Bryobacteraceae bacterium]